MRKERHFRPLDLRPRRGADDLKAAAAMYDCGHCPGRSAARTQQPEREPLPGAAGVPERLAVRREYFRPKALIASTLPTATVAKRVRYPTDAAHDQDGG